MQTKYASEDSDMQEGLIAEAVADLQWLARENLGVVRYSAMGFTVPMRLACAVGLGLCDRILNL
jgi:hypothetical protein